MIPLSSLPFTHSSRVGSALLPEKAFIGKPHFMKKHLPELWSPGSAMEIIWGSGSSITVSLFSSRSSWVLIRSGTPSSACWRPSTLWWTSTAWPDEDELYLETRSYKRNQMSRKSQLSAQRYYYKLQVRKEHYMCLYPFSKTVDIHFHQNFWWR